MSKIIELEKLLKEDKDELKYMEDIKLYFDEVLLDIENKNLKDQDAEEILEVLEEMRIDK